MTPLKKVTSKKLTALLRSVFRLALLSVALLLVHPYIGGSSATAFAQGPLISMNMDAPSTVSAGSQMTYTITIANSGTPLPATLTDNLPPSTTFVSCSANGTGACGGAGNQRTVSFTSLTTATVVFVVAVKCAAATGEVISNTATISVLGSAAGSSTVSTSVSSGLVLTCPPNIVATTSPGLPTAVVNYPAPQFSAACPGMTILSSPPSGSTFPIGTTTVTTTILEAGRMVTQCSFDVTVVDREPPTITCPGDITVTAPPGRSSAVVKFGVPISDNAPGVTFFTLPQSGSIFPIGKTTVRVEAVDASGNRATCSFTVTVIDGELPTISCPENITVTAPPGQASAIVNYSAPQVSDNAPGVTVSSTPPSGSAFPIGVTTVNMTATDSSGNRATCSFTVTVLDKEPPILVCPDNIAAMATQDRCIAAVDYPAPQVSDNAPGVTIDYSSPSGSEFPVGTTRVTVTATDASGNKTTCSFNVMVMGAPRSRLILGGDANRTVLDFAPVVARRHLRSNPPSAMFSVENIGCAPLNLVFASILRLGPNADGVTITDPNDHGLFGLRVLNDNGLETALGIGEATTIGQSRRKDFRVVFNPLIPGVAGRTQGLSANQVIPNQISSQVSMMQNAGDSLRIGLNGLVNTKLMFMNFDNPTRRPLIGFTRSGDALNVEFGVYDSNLDVSRASFQFLDGADKPVGAAIEVDLAQPIRNSGLIRGQSFIVEQGFTGANDNPEIVSARVTVFDGEGNVAAASGRATVSSQTVNSLSSATGARIVMPEIRLKF